MSKSSEIGVLFLLLWCPLVLRAQNVQRYKLDIGKMFELADSNSRSIRTFSLAAEEAGQAVKVAKNAALPTVDVSLSVSYLGDGWMADRDFSHGMNAPMPHFGNNFVLEASQVVYAGGTISNGIAIAELQEQLALLDRENKRQDIRFLLVGNYLELYKLGNQAEVYRRNIEQTRRLLVEIRAREKEGLILKNDITRYELQLKSLELASTRIENSQVIINNELITVLGLPEETTIEVDSNILAQLPLIALESEWQKTAVEVSPLLKQAQIGVRQSERNEKIARAGRLPAVALFAGDHLDGPIIIEVPPINQNFNYWYVGAGLKFNIASLYKTGKNVRLAKLSTEKAVETESLMQENIRTAVKAAWIRFGESFTIYDTQLKSLELATENYQVIRNRYLNDLALITDMLDAVNAKLSAELQVANARINILFNYYSLKKATGNL